MGPAENEPLRKEPFDQEKPRIKQTKKSRSIESISLLDGYC